MAEEEKADQKKEEAGADQENNEASNDNENNPDQGEGDLNLDVENNISKRIKLIKIGVIIFLVVSGVVSIIITKMSAKKEIKQLVPLYETKGNAQNNPKDEKPKFKAAKVKILGKARYYNVMPAFLVGITSRNGKRHYVQFSVSLMTRDTVLFSNLDKHDPVIKSTILAVTSEHLYEELIQPDGRRILKKAILKELKVRLKPLIGRDDLEEVLFTKFLME